MQPDRHPHDPSGVAGSPQSARENQLGGIRQRVQCGQPEHYNSQRSDLCRIGTETGGERSYQVAGAEHEQKRHEAGVYPGNSQCDVGGALSLIPVSGADVLTHQSGGGVTHPQHGNERHNIPVKGDRDRGGHHGTVGVHELHEEVEGGDAQKHLEAGGNPEAQ